MVADQGSQRDHADIGSSARPRTAAMDRGKLIVQGGEPPAEILLLDFGVESGDPP